MSGGANVFGQAFARSLDTGVTYYNFSPEGAIRALVIVSIAGGDQDRHRETSRQVP
jgi:hypothetical protein